MVAIFGGRILSAIGDKIHQRKIIKQANAERIAENAVALQLQHEKSRIGEEARLLAIAVAEEARHRRVSID